MSGKTIASSFGEQPVVLSPKKQTPDTCERIVAFLDIMGFKDMVARHFETIKDKLEKLSSFIGETMDENYQYMIFLIASSFTPKAMEWRCSSLC